MEIARDTTRLGTGRTLRYWTPPRERLTVRDLSLDEAAAELRADVEIACELSGGMDSSSVVAAAAAARDHPITTFTIKVPGQDEEPIARTMLDRYRLDYHVLDRPEDEFLEDAASFTAVMEEPYHSPNIYTHFRMRQRMKEGGAFVVLAGAGGDEVLAGYEPQFWPRAAAEMRKAGLAAQVEAYERVRGWYRPRTVRQRLSGRYWRARGTAIRCVKRLLGRPVGGPPLPPLEGLSAEEYRARYPALTFHQQQLYHVRVAMLPYYLRSNDHVTMAIPIEARYPFLDYRVVELGLQMPIAYLFRDGWTKYVLRRAMERDLPSAILWRREKMGFPFDYQGFLAARRAAFERVLPRLEVLGTSTEAQGGYDALTRADPMKLWRLCSTALWLGSDEEAGLVRL